MTQIPPAQRDRFARVQRTAIIVFAIVEAIVLAAILYFRYSSR